MPRYFIEVSYKGTKYAGFQVQKNAVTIQSEVEKALFTRFRKPIHLTGSSRTDAGVHALQNFFHFDTDEELFDEESITFTKRFQQIFYALNSILPDDIVINRLYKVDKQFHCRFDAISREYKYYIIPQKNPFYKETAYYYPYKIDIDKMQKAASVIKETKDFTSFSKRNTQVHNFICSLIKSEWVIEKDLLIYNVIGNRFLRGMVKGLVGTMLKVGTGKIDLNQFKEIIESKNCVYADFSVPSRALFLIEVKYPEK